MYTKVWFPRINAYMLIEYGMQMYTKVWFDFLV